MLLFSHGELFYDSCFSIQWWNEWHSGIFSPNVRLFHFLLYLLVSLRMTVVIHFWGTSDVWIDDLTSCIHYSTYILKAEFENKSQVLGTNVLFWFLLFQDVLRRKKSCDICTTHISVHGLLCVTSVYCGQWSYRSRKSPVGKNSIRIFMVQHLVSLGVTQSC